MGEPGLRARGLRRHDGTGAAPSAPPTASTWTSREASPALAGVPLGLLVHRAALALAGGAGGGGGGGAVPLLWLVTVVPAALAVVAPLTAVPIRHAASRPVARALAA